MASILSRRIANLLPPIISSTRHEQININQLNNPSNNNLVSTSPSQSPQQQQAHNNNSFDDEQQISLYDKTLRNIGNNIFHGLSSLPPSPRIHSYHTESIKHVESFTSKYIYTVHSFWMNYRPVFDVSQALISILSFVIYVYMSYHFYSVGFALNLLNFIISVYFFVDFLIRLICTLPSSVYYRSSWCIIDILTVLPILWNIHQIWDGNSKFDSFVNSTRGIWYFLTLLRFIRVFKLLNIVGFRRITFFSSSELSRGISSLVLTVVCILVLGGGTIHIIEHVGDGIQLHFHESLYYMVTTMSTVGYGDIVPKTTFGRMMMIIIILTCIIIIPMKTSEFVTSLHDWSKYGRPYRVRRDTPHVVLCCTSDITWDDLETILNEFYHSNHGQSRYDIVILCSAGEFHRKRIMFHIKSTTFHPYVKYIVGSPLSLNDLNKVAIQSAQACFLITNTRSADAEIELLRDEDTLLRAVSIKHFCPLIPIIMTILNPRNKSHLFWHQLCKFPNIQVVCMHEMKMKILATSCICPGVLGLITNLLSSYDFSNDTLLNRSSRDKAEKEYLYGYSYEMYHILLPQFFQQMAFAEAAALIYERCKIVLIAIYRNDRKLQRSRVLLNPGYAGHIRLGDIGCVIAQSIEHTHQILRTDFTQSPLYTGQTQQELREKFVADHVRSRNLGVLAAMSNIETNGNSSINNTVPSSLHLRRTESVKYRCNGITIRQADVLGSEPSSYRRLKFGTSSAGQEGHNVSRMSSITAAAAGLTVATSQLDLSHRPRNQSKGTARLSIQVAAENRFHSNLLNQTGLGRSHSDVALSNIEMSFPKQINKLSTLQEERKPEQTQSESGIADNEQNAAFQVSIVQNAPIDTASAAQSTFDKNDVPSSFPRSSSSPSPFDEDGEFNYDRYHNHVVVCGYVDGKIVNFIKRFRDSDDRPIVLIFDNSVCFPLAPAVHQFILQNFHSVHLIFIAKMMKQRYQRDRLYLSYTSPCFGHEHLHEKVVNGKMNEKELRQYFRHHSDEIFDSSNVLRRACVHRADSIVVLANPFQNDRNNLKRSDNSNAEEIVRADQYSLMLYYAISSYLEQCRISTCPSINVNITAAHFNITTVELVHHTNVRLLKSDMNTAEHFTPTQCAAKQTPISLYYQDQNKHHNNVKESRRFSSMIDPVEKQSFLDSLMSDATSASPYQHRAFLTMDGLVFSGKMLDALIVQAFYHPQIYDTVNALVSGSHHQIDDLDLQLLQKHAQQNKCSPFLGSSIQPQTQNEELDDMFQDPNATSICDPTIAIVDECDRSFRVELLLVDMPEEYVGQRYDHLVLKMLLECGWVVLGLYRYRTQQSMENEFSSCVSNADDSTLRIDIPAVASPTGLRNRVNRTTFVKGLSYLGTQEEPGAIDDVNENEDPDNRDRFAPRSQFFVVCNPQPETRLHSKDRIYVLVQKQEKPSQKLSPVSRHTSTSTATNTTNIPPTNQISVHTDKQIDNNAANKLNLSSSINDSATSVAPAASDAPYVAALLENETKVKDDTTNSNATHSRDQESTESSSTDITNSLVRSNSDHLNALANDDLQQPSAANDDLQQQLTEQHGMISQLIEMVSQLQNNNQKTSSPLEQHDNTINGNAQHRSSFSSESSSTSPHDAPPSHVRSMSNPYSSYSSPSSSHPKSLFGISEFPHNLTSVHDVGWTKVTDSRGDVIRSFPTSSMVNADGTNSPVLNSHNSRRTPSITPTTQRTITPLFRLPPRHSLLLTANNSQNFLNSVSTSNSNSMSSANSSGNSNTSSNNSTLRQSSNIVSWTSIPSSSTSTSSTPGAFSRSTRCSMAFNTPASPRQSETHHNHDHSPTSTVPSRNVNITDPPTSANSHHV